MLSVCRGPSFSEHRVDVVCLSARAHCSVSTWMILSVCKGSSFSEHADDTVCLSVCKGPLFSKHTVDTVCLQVFLTLCPFQGLPHICPLSVAFPVSPHYPVAEFRGTPDLGLYGAPLTQRHFSPWWWVTRCLAPFRPLIHKKWLQLLCLSRVWGNIFFVCVCGKVFSRFPEKLVWFNVKESIAFWDLK